MVFTIGTTLMEMAAAPRGGFFDNYPEKVSVGVRTCL